MLMLMSSFRSLRFQVGFLAADSVAKVDFLDHWPAATLWGRVWGLGFRVWGLAFGV